MDYNESKYNKNWKTMKLSDLGEFASGKSTHRPRNDKNLFEGGGYPLVQTGEIKEANLYITPHDLRRTFGTVANSLNISYPVLKRLLNHREAKSSDDVTLQYIQVSQRQLREALNSIESFYCQHAGMTQSDFIKQLI